MWLLLSCLAFALAAAGCTVPAPCSPQEPQVPQDPKEPPAAPQPAPEAPQWTFSGSVYSYVVPDGDDYLQPTITADRGPLHLEARYQYEDRETASLWVGHNFEVGEELTWEATPMFGVVFGDTDGIAPGYRTTLSWRALELYSEGEYLIDTNDSSDSFFYTWSEWTVQPVDALRVGAVIQRTRLYDAERDVQRGLLVGLDVGPVAVTAVIFNPDDSEPLLVFAAGVDF